MKIPQHKTYFYNLLKNTITPPHLYYKDRFWRKRRKIKNKNISQSLLFEQEEPKHKEHRLRFEVETKVKSLSVANEFAVLTPINKKSYIFAFNVFAEQNRAKIYKRVENANI